MANVFLNLPVPAGSGVGAWVDVSGMVPERTISVDGGAFDGQILIEGSNDGQASAIPTSAGPFTGPTQAPQIFVQAWNFLRVRRTQSSGVGAPAVNLAAAPALSNVFGALVVPNGDGVGPALSVAAGGDVNTFGVSGPFSGQLLVETSTDGVNFSPTLIFNAGDGVAQTVLGVLSAARVRRRGTTGGALPLLSAGSQATAGSSSPFPGFGPAPPPVSPVASSGGALASAARSDHTHLAGPAARAGANLGDASVTIHPAVDAASLYTMPAATMTAARDVALGDDGPPQTNMTVQIVRRDLTPNVLTVHDAGGALLFTFATAPPAAEGATFFFDGAAWEFLSFYFVGAGP